MYSRACSRVMDANLSSAFSVSSSEGFSDALSALSRITVLNLPSQNAAVFLTISSPLESIKTRFSSPLFLRFASRTFLLQITSFSLIPGSSLKSTVMLLHEYLMTMSAACIIGVLKSSLLTWPFNTTRTIFSSLLYSTFINSESNTSLI